MSAEIATTHRFVAVLSKKIELGRAFNVLGHMALGLIPILSNQSKLLRFQNYYDADGNTHASISDNPFIVLKADNSNKLRTLREQLIQMDIPFTNFTSTMVEGSYREQHLRTKATNEIDLEYYGICFFAENAIAKEVTKKFSLYI